MATSNINPARIDHQAGYAAHRAATSPWAKGLARAGYATRGVIYLLIGVFAARASIGSGSPTDRKGALLAIYHEPFGTVLLAIIAVGLVGYALWHVIRALVDPEGKGTDAKGLITRAAYLGIAISYGALAAAVIRLLSGTGSTGKSSDATAQDWTATLLSKPFGVGLVVLVGVIVLIIAGVLYVQAWTARFERSLNLGMAGEKRKGIVMLGRVGYAALGFVFTVIGIFLIVAALHHNPHQARGIGGTLVLLAQQPFGQLLLLLVALGLVAYGIYSFAEARYHRIGI